MVEINNEFCKLSFYVYTDIMIHVHPHIHKLINSRRRYLMSLDSKLTYFSYWFFIIGNNRKYLRCFYFPYIEPVSYLLDNHLLGDPHMELFHNHWTSNFYFLGIGEICIQFSWSTLVEFNHFKDGKMSNFIEIKWVHFLEVDWISWASLTLLLQIHPNHHYITNTKTKTLTLPQYQLPAIIHLANSIKCLPH